jgi:hypothetical protein
MRTLIYSLLLLAVPVLAEAQVQKLKPATPSKKTEEAKPTDEPVNYGWRLDKEQKQKIKVGIIVTAETVCRGISATAPIPFDWPEQKVEIAHEDFTPLARGIAYRPVGTSAKQMVLTIPNMPAGDVAQALVTYEVTKFAQLPPEDPSIYVMPNLKKLKPDVRVHLGPSPYIETTNPKFRATIKEVIPDKSIGAWEKVEKIYDWTREHVEFKHGPLKGAIQAMKDGFGDAEELVGVFIALCRVSEVPARMVWVPGHVYAEFYLEDADGKGYWFPAQVAGTREFGGINDYRPILMKGDNFVTAERPKDRQRFIAEFLTGSGGKPRVQFVREMVE